MWEWNEAVLDGSSRGLRGGSFNDYFFGFAVLRASSRFNGNPAYEDNNIGFRVASITPPCTQTIAPDADHDCDVDQDDVDAFAACASGSTVPIAGGCEDKDFDHDGDGDQSDFATVQRCFSGENIPADPDCAK